MQVKEELVVTRPGSKPTWKEGAGLCKGGGHPGLVSVPCPCVSVPRDPRHGNKWWEQQETDARCSRQNCQVQHEATDTVPCEMESLALVWSWSIPPQLIPLPALWAEWGLCPPWGSASEPHRACRVSGPSSCWSKACGAWGGVSSSGPRLACRRSLAAPWRG